MKITIDAHEQVILVDEANREIGVSAKIETHKHGVLHRAFSIFLFSADGRTLVQRRAVTKYHSGGEWANTCCGHPRPGEPIVQAAQRRLHEELGMEADLEEAFHIRYKALLANDMIENEYVHVFVGLSTHKPVPNPSEVCEYGYHNLDSLADGSAISTDRQTAWLRHYMAHHLQQLVSARAVALNRPQPERGKSDI